MFNKFYKRFLPLYPLKKIKKIGKLFIHIPKNGGTSFIESIYGKSYRRNHTPAYIYKSLLLSEYDKIHKLCVIRDPVERCFSTYKYLNAGGNNREDIPLSKTINAKCRNFKDFLYFIEEEKLYTFHVMFLPQWFWISINGSLAIDEIINLTDLDNYFQKNNLKATHANKSFESNESFESDVIDKIKKIYEIDYKKLKFS